MEKNFESSHRDKNGKRGKWESFCERQSNQAVTEKVWSWRLGCHLKWKDIKQSFRFLLKIIDCISIKKNHRVIHGARIAS